MIKRNCSFVSNVNKRKALYLSQIRSQFEHCPIIWRPSSKSCVDKLESIQKRGFKWILKTYISFSSTVYYYHTCKQLNILPINIRFDLKDLIYFHSIFYGLSIVKFPSYIFRFSGSNLRYCHLDKLSVQSSVHPKVRKNLEVDASYTGIAKSFFYRAHCAWNKLPIEIRKIESPSLFKKKLTEHLWKESFLLITLPYDIIDELNE